MDAKLEDSGFRIFNGSWDLYIEDMELIKEIHRITSKLIEWEE